MFQLCPSSPVTTVIKEELDIGKDNNFPAVEVMYNLISCYLLPIYSYATSHEDK